MPKVLAFVFMALLWTVLQCSVAHAQSMRIIRDAEIENTIKNIGRPVFEQAGFTRDGIRIVIVENNSLNAFVAGGHNIFLHTGLLLRAEHPGELAGVLAHEVSHIASGHVVRSQSAMEGISFQAMLATVLGIATAIGTGSSDAGAAVMAGGQAAAVTNLLKYSRTQESAADQGAVFYLNAAGISPRGLLTFMEKLEHEELLPASQQSEYIRTHPLTADRISFLRHAVERSRHRDKPLPEAWERDFSRMRAKLLGYLFPERVLNPSPDQPQDGISARYAKSIALYRRGRMAESLELVDGLIAEEPENPYFHEFKGQVLFESGQGQQAAASYKKAVDLAGRDGTLIKIDYAHVLLGLARGLQGVRDGEAQQREILDEAITLLQQAQEQENHNPRLYHFLATSYGMQGQEGYARLNLAEEALLRNDLDAAERQISYAEANLPETAGQARLRLQDLKELVEQRRADRKRR